MKKFFKTMENKEIQALHLLEKVVAEVLNRDDIKLEEGMSAPDIEGWDSLNHVQIIFYCEQELGVAFPVQEIQELNTIGDLLNLINKYL